MVDQFRFSEHGSKMLEHMRYTLDYEMRKEVLTTALEYFYFFIEEIQKGKEIYLMENKDINQIQRVKFPNVKGDMIDG